MIENAETRVMAWRELTRSRERVETFTTLTHGVTWCEQRAHERARARIGTCDTAPAHMSRVIITPSPPPRGQTGKVADSVFAATAARRDTYTCMMFSIKINNIQYICECAVCVECATVLYLHGKSA